MKASLSCVAHAFENGQKKAAVRTASRTASVDGESGAIEQDADLVVLLHREDMYEAEGDFFYSTYQDLWGLAFDPRAMWQSMPTVQAPVVRLYVPPALLTNVTPAGRVSRTTTPVAPSGPWFVTEMV